MAPLTAYTLISLLEMYAQFGDNSTELSSKLLHNTLPCLEPEPESPEPDPYTVALTAYALTLAGRSEAARRHISWLLDHSRTNHSMLWWEKPGN